MDFFSEIGQKIKSKVEDAILDLKKDFREKLQKPGSTITDDIVVASVVDVDAGKNVLVTVVFRKTIEHLLQGLPGFIRAGLDIKFDKHDLQTGPDIPRPLNVDVVSFMAELTGKTQAFELKIGAGYDSKTVPPYKVARFMLKLVNITFDAFLGGISDEGIALTIGAISNTEAVTPESVTSLPICIPLGTTGWAITGIKGTFAKNFSPRFTPAKEHPTTQEYVAWARNQQRNSVLDAWTPHASASGIGLSCSLITLADQGKLFKFHDVGFTFLEPPVMVLLGGAGRLLDCELAELDGLGAINFGDKNFFFGVGAKFRIPADHNDGFEIFQANGSIETYISFSEPSSSYYNLGTDSAPIQGAFFKDVLACSVFAMINTRRVKTGARLWIDRSLRLGPIACSYRMRIEGDALLGWNPIQVFGAMALSIGFSVKLWRFSFGIDLKIGLSLSISTPVRLIAYVEITLGLPWPLSDVKFGFNVIDFEKYFAPKIDSTLRLNGKEAFGETGLEPGAVHPLTARQWNLANQKIWPDAELVIPFSRRPVDRTGVIRPYVAAPVIEQGYSVLHELTKLSICRVHENGCTEVNGVKGVWAAGPDSLGTAILHLPGDNPFAWWWTYEENIPIAQDEKPRIMDQDFGTGPDISPLPDGYRFGEIVFHRNSATNTDLVSSPGYQDDSRVIVGRKFTLSFSSNIGQALPVDEVTLFVLTRDPDFVVPSGLKLIDRQLVNDQGRPRRKGLWAFRLQSQNGKPFSTISFDQNDRSAVNLLRVRYRVVPVTSQTWENKKILEPGLYRLQIEGKSSAAYPGVQTPTPLEWKREQQFEVIYPELLRPYIHYTTLGDSRIFSGRTEQWNPTPFGVGFSAYQSYRGIIRFHVPYMDQIFREFTLSMSGHTVDGQQIDVPPFEKKPIANQIMGGETFLPERDRQWVSRNGGVPEPNQEVEFDTPAKAGQYQITVSYKDPNKPQDPPKKLDNWSFRVSRFSDFRSHVAIDTVATILRAHDVEGLAPDPGAKPRPAPPTTSKRVSPILPKDWWLPDSLAAHCGPITETAGLRFLRFAQRSNCRFGTHSGGLLERILQVPRSSQLEALLDDRGRPYCLWLRTPEPLDWRRVSGNLVFITDKLSGPNKDSLPIFEISVLPSPDGCSAFLVALSGDQPARLPMGPYEMNLDFRERVERESPFLISTLRRNSGTTQLGSETLSVRFVQPFGEEWPNF